VSLELAQNNGSPAATVPVADILLMDAVQIMRCAMHKLACIGRWEQAAHIAALLAPYTHETCGVRAAVEDKEHDCRCN
jgi:hypothetical protein